MKDRGRPNEVIGEVGHSGHLTKTNHETPELLTKTKGVTPCDHCGKEAAHHVWIEVEHFVGDEILGYDAYNADLCDDCAKPIIELLEKKSA